MNIGDELQHGTWCVDYRPMYEYEDCVIRRERVERTLDVKQ